MLFRRWTPRRRRTRSRGSAGYPPFHLKTAAIIAGVMGLVAAGVVATDDLVLSACFGVPAAVLLVASFKG